MLPPTTNIGVEFRVRSDRAVVGLSARTLRQGALLERWRALRVDSSTIAEAANLRICRIFRRPQRDDRRVDRCDSVPLPRLALIRRRRRVRVLRLLHLRVHGPDGTRGNPEHQGQEQPLRTFGPRDGDPIIVSSSDGGWVRLAPHVADVLAARGFFVVGLDVKTYLESFTTGTATLRAEDEPADYRVLADFASQVTHKKPILIGVSEGAGLSVLAATNPKTKAAIAGVIAFGSGSQRTRVALERFPDLRDARRAERADRSHLHAD